MHNVHRRTVRAAFSSAIPPPRKAPERVMLVSGPWVETITGWLQEDLTRPKKQRHTGRRVWQRLAGEEGAVLAESTVTHAVARLRRELVSGLSQVMVTQTHGPAEEAEVDFGKIWATTKNTIYALCASVTRRRISAMSGSPPPVPTTATAATCSPPRPVPPPPSRSGSPSTGRPALFRSRSKNCPRAPPPST